MSARRPTPIGLAALVAVVFVTSPALAKPDFPRTIQKHLGLGYAPGCSLCHDRASIDGSTVRTPFGLSMRAHGFSGKRDLEPSLDALAADHTDSDADGTGDVAELLAGTDPNSPAPGAVLGDPAYGCGAHVAPRPSGHPGARVACVLVALAAFSLRRRVRRARR